MLEQTYTKLKLPYLLATHKDQQLNDYITLLIEAPSGAYVEKPDPLKADDTNKTNIDTRIINDGAVVEIKYTLPDWVTNPSLAFSQLLRQFEALKAYHKMHPKVLSLSESAHKLPRQSNGQKVALMTIDLPFKVEDKFLYKTYKSCGRTVDIPGKCLFKLKDIGVRVYKLELVGKSTV